MATKLYDACVVSDSYEKDGKTKNTYRKIGTMFENEKGQMSLKLDRFFNPIGALNKDRECWITMFEQKTDNKQSNNDTEPSLQSDPIPF